MNSPFSLKNIAAAIGFFTVSRTIFSMIYTKFRSHQENTADLPQSSHQNSVVSSLSILSHTRKHQVFPSFHGSDVRRSFLSHILKEFTSKGIDLFIDNNIERSKSIGPELIEAIRGSRIATVLLSKNYASSTWCLDELVEIIKCREVLGQIVMVIFYEVDPTDVKKQTGEFGKVFRKTCQGKTEDYIGRWKQALAEVATIAGYHSRNWDNEAEMIKSIATDVSNKLNNSTLSNDFDGLVGMKSHMDSMGQLLKLYSEEAMIIGIVGPPGIGKTTIARCLFNQHSQDFQLSFFMDNIRESYPVPARSDDYSVKKYLQEQFMSTIINHEGFHIHHLESVKDRLKEKKVLVVLDDVNRLVQLEAIVKETSWFGPGSRIIITTQDQKILQAHGVNGIYKVNFPSRDEALEMFCMYAFDQKFPRDGFEGLAREVTTLVGNLPLGLRVMGSYFRGMSVQDWTTAVLRLRTRLDGEIESILKYSYDALHREDQSLFLHIACFFNGESVEILEDCLANSLSVPNVKLGFRVLIEKSLIYLERGRIEMHKLLSQLGREIVRKQCISERQFLVGAIDHIGEVFRDDKADTSKVLGLYLWLSKEDTELVNCTREIAFERFCNLQFLKFYDGTAGSFKLNENFIPRKLRYLKCNRLPISCFPSGFQTKFLVKLDMRASHLEKLWDGIQPLSNLKEMDLSFSKRLKELPDLSTATNLYLLDLRFCSSLEELPSSMKNLRKLSELMLYRCSKLEVNLTNINLESLKELYLSECSSLKCHPETTTNIEDLNPSGTAVKEVSSLSNSQIQELDPWIGRVSNLSRLELSEMPNLVSLPQLPYSVTELDAYDCKSLERLDCSFRNPGIRLIFACCYKLNQEARDLIIHTRTNDYAVLPGGEVPECFTYRASGSSLKLKLNHKPLRTSMKFTACILLAEKDYEFGEGEEGPEYGDGEEESDYGDGEEGPEYGDGKGESDYGDGEEESDYGEGEDEPEYGDGKGETDYGDGEEESDYGDGEEGPEYGDGKGETDYGDGDEESDYGEGEEESDYGDGEEESDYGDDEEFTVYRYGEEVKVHCSITSKQNVTAFSLGLKLFPEHLYIFEVEAEEVTSTELVFEFEPLNLKKRYPWKIKECGVMQLLEVPSCDEQNNKRFRYGGEDSDMERQILKPKLDREASGERKWWR